MKRPPESPDHQERLAPESRDVKKAFIRLKALGLPTPERPPGEPPSWPQNLADLTDDELSEHLTFWSGICAYARMHLGQEAAEVVSFRTEAQKVKTLRFLEAEGKVTDRRTQAAGDEAVQTLEASQVRHEINQTLLAQLVEGYERKYAAASRERARRLGRAAQNE